MSSNISEIEELIKLISKLPGLGSKSAKRIVLKLINNRQELMKPMAKALTEVYKEISRCNNCGALKSNSLGKLKLYTIIETKIETIENNKKIK